MCDYSDAYIAVKATLNFSAAAAKENDKAQNNFTFKNNALFRSCISKIKSMLIENAQDLITVIPM